MKKYFEIKKISLIAVSFIVGFLLASVYFLKVVNNQNLQMAHLISISQELFGLQKSIILADSEAYNIATECMLNSSGCDQKAQAEKLEKLTEGRNLMTGQVDKLSKEIEQIISDNNWK